MRPKECNGCLKFRPANGSCIALTDLYIHWGKPDTVCWAKETNLTRWQQTLDDISLYSGAKPTNNYKPSTDEVISCLIDEQTRHTIKGGSSEKNPSIWSKARLSDNRYKEPWGK